MSRIFSAGKNIYWSAEYADLLAAIKGSAPGTKQRRAPIYKFNTGIIVLAGIIGFSESIEREVGSERQEISLDTLESHDLASTNLASYVLLVPVLATGDLSLLRKEREDELLRTFERYANGGLSHLERKFNQMGRDAVFPLLRDEVNKALSMTPLEISLAELKISQGKGAPG